MSPHFQDTQHVEALRRALWTNREFGRAAVMVGAGMSRNAVSRRAGQASMPTWNDLTSSLISHLFPTVSVQDQRRAWLQTMSSATSVANRLAQEYEVTFGRSKLDDLIRESIPDDDFAPGPLHRLLLELPWADVLTTNYDTLLERAASDVLNRRYSTIRRPQDIASCDRPRIVKLHGSFPSNGPFILTEDDFRTYPTKFAPYVNLARQTVMECSLCLIGFSGDDPNFLAWSGWVREELAQYSPRIYLYGLLDLTSSQRRVLESRGVMPIDLTPLFPVSEYPQATRHAQGLECFLKYLETGRPYSVQKWSNPYSGSQDDSKATPKILIEQYNLPKQEPRPLQYANQTNAIPEEELNSLAQIWAHNRALYPGWLIAPDEAREQIWNSTKEWIQPILKHRQTLKADQQLVMLEELIWRLDLSLLPMWPDLTTFCEEILSLTNPFPNLQNEFTPSAAATKAKNTDQAPINDRFRQRWLNVAFGLFRFYREERLEAEFELWSGRLSRLSLTADDQARLCFERCLYALAKMDDQGAEQSLKNWPDDAADQAWAIRKAGLLAELEHFDEALRIVQESISSLRTGLTNSEDNIFALSREGWAMRLSNCIQSAKRWSLGDHSSRSGDNLNERFEQLKRFACDPRELSDWFEIRLNRPVPVEEPTFTTTAGFEPDELTASTHSGGNEYLRFQVAYQYLRFAELTGIPPAIAQLDYAKILHLRAAEWLAETDPVRTHSIMFRLLDDKVVKSYLSRHRVAALNQTIIDQWRVNLVAAIDHAMAEPGPVHVRPLIKHSRAVKRLNMGMLILARLIVRTPDSEREQLWQFAQRFSVSPSVRLQSVGRDEFKAYWKALAGTTTPEEMKTRLNTLLDVPLPNDYGYHTVHANLWPDPAQLFNYSISRTESGLTPQQFPVARQRAIAGITSTDNSLRFAAMARCYLLNWLGLLTTSEQKMVAKVFWNSLQESEHLPWGAWEHVTTAIAVSFPTPKGQSAEERIKADFLDLHLGEVHGGQSQSEWHLKWLLRVSKRPLAQAQIGEILIDWTAEERTKLFAKMFNWWEEFGKKKAINNRESRVMDIFDSKVIFPFLEAILDVIRQLFLPHTSPSAPLGKKILAFIADLSTHQLPVGSALPATLFARPANQNSTSLVTSGLRREFAHHNQEFYLSAMRGLVHWVELSHDRNGKNPKFPTIPVDLLNELGSAVATRREDVIRLALQASRQILYRLRKGSPLAFRERLIDGLEYLFTEAAYSPKKSELMKFSYDDVPPIRAEAVALARCLAEIGHVENSVIKTWLEQGLNDPLPEVRRAASPSLRQSTE